MANSLSLFQLSAQRAALWELGLGSPRKRVHVIREESGKTPLSPSQQYQHHRGLKVHGWRGCPVVSPEVAVCARHLK